MVVMIIRSNQVGLILQSLSFYYNIPSMYMIHLNHTLILYYIFLSCFSSFFHIFLISSSLHFTLRSFLYFIPLNSTYLKENMWFSFILLNLMTYSFIYFCTNGVILLLFMASSCVCAFFHIPIDINMNWYWNFVPSTLLSYTMIFMWIHSKVKEMVYSLYGSLQETVSSNAHMGLLKSQIATVFAPNATVTLKVESSKIVVTSGDAWVS